MKIFVAGATGAIGSPLVSQLLSAGHEVFGMTRTKKRAEQLAKSGVRAVIADAFDRVALLDALQSCQPEVVVEMLTTLPKEYTPQAMQESAEINTRLKLEGGANLQNAAEAIGVRRYILQSSAFWYAPGEELAKEENPFAVDPSIPVAAAANVYAEQEKRVLKSKNLEGISLRFGFFYGPKTWFAKGGSMANQVKAQSYPIVGAGTGVWSFVQVEDAAKAITLALDCPLGAYNITNDTPLKLADWLPAYAKWLQAPPPLRRTIEEEMTLKGPTSVYYATKLRGACNAKAKRVLGFQPRPLEWL